MDHLGLVETVDGLGESVVIGISDTADRRFDTGFSQALSVFDGVQPILAAIDVTAAQRDGCSPA
jgi:hypothetical protein